jgi:cardiolipin synthase A/B
MQFVGCDHKQWGAGDSNPIAGPNPRLALRSNRATADYLHTLAQAERLDLEVRLGNPTGGGIHAKLVLVRVGGETWPAVGSLNGGEVSHKLNREVVVMVDHPLVYARLLEIFLHDWALVTP